MTTEPTPQANDQSPLVAFARRISLDWWAVITSLVLALLVLAGILNIPW